jgi:hypothetical protein
MDNQRDKQNQQDKQDKQNEQNEQNGGDGATEWGQSVYGTERNAQGAISTQLPPQTGGVGLTEAVVPVVLFLANNAVSKKLLSQTGLSSKQIKGGNVQLPDGGSLANSIAVPAGLVLANHYLGKSLRSRPKPYLGTRRPSFNKSKGRKSITKRGRFSRGKFRKNR